MKIGERIEQRRKAMKLTRVALARMIGMSSTALGKIEEGTTKVPRDVMTIAKVLNVTPAWLQFGEGKNDVTSIQVTQAEQDLIMHLRQLSDSEQAYFGKCVRGFVSETYKKT